MRISCAVALLTCGILTCSAPTSPDDSDPPAAAPSDVAAAVIDFTNVQRTRAGLVTFRANSRLIQAAQIHAEQMARAGVLNHVIADATYPSAEDRLAAVEYRWRTYAENIAFGQRTAAEVVEGWMRSDGHRANILNGSLTEMGAGYARDPNGRAYWVQVFGRPLA